MRKKVLPPNYTPSKLETISLCVNVCVCVCMCVYAANLTPETVSADSFYNWKLTGKFECNCSIITLYYIIRS